MIKNGTSQGSIFWVVLAGSDIIMTRFGLLDTMKELANKFKVGSDIKCSLMVSMS